MIELRKLAIPLASSTLVIGFGTAAHAETVCIAITAEIAYMDDPSGTLPETIGVGDVITGTYVYESTTPDTNGAPTVGDYWHTTAPFGITLNLGEYVFRTDPDNVNFLVEIVNDHGDPPGDNYLLRSYTNLFDIGSNSENHISWQLDDPTSTALSSEALPVVPPVLADWQSIFGLDIMSGFFFDGFLIRSHVTSASLCGDTASRLVAICHRPETSAEHTLFVAQAAVPGHLGHGDALDECP